jgi:hypothetical protein
MMLQKGVSIIKPEEFYEHQIDLDKNKEELPHD